MGCTLLLFAAFSAAGADYTAWRRFPACLHTHPAAVAACWVLASHAAAQYYHWPMLSVSSVQTFFSAITFALTLLLVFKTNSSYSRCVEPLPCGKDLLRSDQPHSGCPAVHQLPASSELGQPTAQPKKCGALLVCCRWWEARKDVGQLVSLVHDLVRQVLGVGRQIL